MSVWVCAHARVRIWVHAFSFVYGRGRAMARTDAHECAGAHECTPARVYVRVC